MSTLAKTDLIRLKNFVDNYAFLVDACPELFKVEDIDDMKIAAQILEEEINE
jgi:hypothetical protein